VTESSKALPPSDSTFEGFAEASTGRLEPTTPIKVTANPTCIAVTPPSEGACGKPAARIVTFFDGDKALMCAPCAMYYEAKARELNTSIKVERLGGSHGR
jgi:hypothetical protein